MTITDAVSGYLTHLDDQILLGDRKPGTRTFYDWQFRHLLRVAGYVPIEQFNARDVSTAPATNAFRRAVRRLFNFHDVKIPRGLSVPQEGQRQRTATRREYRRLCLAAVGQVPWMLALIRHAGMRPQEVRELTWDRVHEGERVIELTRFKGRERRKDGKRVRWIPIPRHLARLFARARAVLRPHPEQLVFANRRGGAWSCQSFRCAVRRAVLVAGLDQPGKERLTAYSLRHTFGTNYLRGRKRAGGNVVMLGETMGHADLNTTRRYCHPSKQALVDALDHAMGG